MKPTREQIESATPEELNVMVAEMMGWRWLRSPYSGDRHLLSPESIADPDFSLWCDAVADDPISPISWEEPPAWSTGIAAAMTVLDYIAATNKMTQWTLQGGVYSPEVTIERIESPLESAYTTADTLPLAIVRAALLWWIEQPIME